MSGSLDVAKCVCARCTERKQVRELFERSYQAPLFSTKADAFIWGALVGVLLLLGAALIGRIAFQVFGQ